MTENKNICTYDGQSLVRFGLQHIIGWRPNRLLSHRQKVAPYALPIQSDDELSKLRREMILKKI